MSFGRGSQPRKSSALSGKSGKTEKPRVSFDTNLPAMISAHSLTRATRSALSRPPPAAPHPLEPPRARWQAQEQPQPQGQPQEEELLECGMARVQLPASCRSSGEWARLVAARARMLRSEHAAEEAMRKKEAERKARAQLTSAQQQQKKQQELIALQQLMVPQKHKEALCASAPNFTAQQAMDSLSAAMEAVRGSAQQIDLHRASALSYLRSEQLKAQQLLSAKKARPKSPHHLSPMQPGVLAQLQQQQRAARLAQRSPLAHAERPGAAEAKAGSGAGARRGSLSARNLETTRRQAPSRPSARLTRPTSIAAEQLAQRKLH